MARRVVADVDFESISKLINVPTPQNPGDAANKAYVDALIEGLAWKDNARVRCDSNVNLASPGSSLDSIAMASGDRVLLLAQSTQSQNGVYVWTGSGVPMTRTTDASTAAELENAIVAIDEGGGAQTSFRQTQLNFVLGTDPVLWTNFFLGAPAASETVQGISELATQAETNTGTDDTRSVTPLKLSNWTGRIRRAAFNVGNGSATQFTLLHNFGTYDVVPEVFRNSAPYDSVIVDVDRPSINEIRLTFAAPPTTNQFRAIVRD